MPILLHVPPVSIPSVISSTELHSFFSLLHVLSSLVTERLLPRLRASQQKNVLPLLPIRDKPLFFAFSSEILMFLPFNLFFFSFQRLFFLTSFPVVFFPRHTARDESLFPPFWTGIKQERTFVAGLFSSIFCLSCPYFMP